MHIRILKELSDLGQGETQVASGYSVEQFAAVGGFSFHRSSRSIRLSEGACRLLRFESSGEEPSVQTLLGRIDGSGRRSLRSAYADCLRNVGPASFKIGFYAGEDGRKIVCEGILEASQEASESTEPVLSGFFRDITRQEALEEEHHLFQEMLDQSLEGALCLNEKGEIIRMNRAVEAITGYSEDLLLGRHFECLLSDRHEEELLKEILDGLEGESRWSGEIWAEREDGEAFPQWTSVSLLPESRISEARYAVVFSDLSELRRMRNLAERITSYDSLTNLPNREVFMTTVGNRIEELQEGRSLAVLCLGLDKFAKINENFGMERGDKVLEQVAKRLDSMAGIEYSLARGSGDEFLVLLPQLVNPADAVQFADDLRNLFRRPVRVGDTEHFISLSVGVSIYPDDGKVTQQLFQNAVSALRAAKEQGGALTRVHKPGLEEEIRERLTLENDLRKAALNEDFVLYYQPVIDLQEDKVVSAEALIRWCMPDGTIQSPGLFIPVAEDMGLIQDIGKWVLRQACEDLSATEGLSKISVNLSARQFSDSKLVQSFNQIVEVAGVAAENIDLEITESAIIHDLDEALPILKEFAETGFSITMDDFGTGYSSLSYLKMLPVRKLKIDRSFIQGIPRAKDDVGIVGAILSMARFLNLEVVAEGVEKLEQLALLRSLHCDFAQGFYIAKPMPIEEFRDLLKDWDPDYLTR